METTQEISMACPEAFEYTGPAMKIEKAVVHPLVLRNIVNNYNRVAKDSGKRVVGVLLGSSSRGIVSVTNSYAVPFEEDDKRPHWWFFYQTHHESMLVMFKSINAMEDVVGWYSNCFTLQGNDLDLHAMFRGYVRNPVLVLIDVNSKELGIPTIAYCALDDVNEIAIATLKSSKEPFIHVCTVIAPPEVQDIGTSTTSTLVSEMSDRVDLVDFIECHYSFVKNKVQISVEGYDLSLQPYDLDRSLVEHFGSCGVVEYVKVPRHPLTNAITHRCTIVTLRGERAAEKALALNGSDVGGLGGWRVTVKLLPPTMKELRSEKSPRQLALEYVARNH